MRNKLRLRDLNVTIATPRLSVLLGWGTANSTSIRLHSAGLWFAGINGSWDACLLGLADMACLLNLSEVTIRYIRHKES